MSSKKDFLWKGLPAVFYESKYIIFSPYSKKIISLKEKELRNKIIIGKLKKENFFGSSLTKVDDRLAITLYLTDNCNLKCIYCFDDCDGCMVRQKINKEMASQFAISSIKRILKDYNQFIQNLEKPKLKIHFFGGEPTLKFDVIKKVVEFLEKQKIDTIYEISTNLITSEERLNYLISKKFLFAVSCDGIPKINNKQRPFKIKSKIMPSEIIEQRIKQLVKAKARIRPKVVVTNESIKEMPSAVKYLAKLGLSHIRLEPLLIDGRVEKNNLKPVNIEQFIKYFLKASEVAKELSKKYKRHIYVSNWAIRNLFQPRDYFCEIVRGNRIAIMPDGIIAKCVRNLHAYESSPFIVGKINNKLILKKQKYKQLQEISVDKMPFCENCFAKYICSGCCPNENLKENKTFFIPTKYKCKIAKKLIRELLIKMYKESKFKKL